MLTRRIIPCLDVKDGRVVKGIEFKGLRDVGDPVEFAQRYAATGADELCFLDVTASIETRPLLYGLIEQISRHIRIPFSVGGGVRTVDDGVQLLRAGADKIALNTAAVKDPPLISELSDRFGAQCIVLSIDTINKNGDWWVTTRGGRDLTEWSCHDWAKEAVRLGAGEILLNAINADGTRDGFALDVTRQVAQAVNVPVIASGGAGTWQHFEAVFTQTGASAALAASIFHDGSTTPDEIKRHLDKHGIRVRR